MTEPEASPCLETLTPTSGLLIAVLVTAAGASTRYGTVKKELERLNERSVLDLALAPFFSLPGLCALAITAPIGRIAELRASLDHSTLESTKGFPFDIVQGGATRRDSVLYGLEALDRMVRDSGLDPRKVVVLVHDGARPWASARLVATVAEATKFSGACIPVIALADTPKVLSPDGIIVSHLRRSSLGGAQTPQGFFLAPLLAIHRQAAVEKTDCTDDAELWSLYKGQVSWVEGEISNRKITYMGDLFMTEKNPKPENAPAIASVSGLRIGEGWDLHRLVTGRQLLVGSVAIKSPLGEDAHSDGDVLWHAVIDALFGACALGDIGSHFPPTDTRWKDADSAALAATAASLVRKAGYRPVNLDCTVVLESPKIGPHRDAIRANLARVLDMDIDAVSVKAKTHEKVDAVGELRAIEARVVVLLEKYPR